MQGYILKIQGSRQKIFEDHSNNGRFAEPVPDFSNKRGSPLVVFISSKSGLITHVALGSPGQKAGTNLRRLNLEDMHSVESFLSFTKVLKYTPRNIQRHISRAFKNGGVLPPKSFEGLVSSIEKLDPNFSSILTRYGKQRRVTIAQLTENVRESLAAQKEALVTALSIADINRKPLLEWTPSPTKKTTSFLDGLPQAYLREDLMIFNDLGIIPGLNKIKSSVMGIASFENQEVRLDVILANRTRLEEQTGADLIYYNATYKSFIMVQYKVMEQPSDEFKTVFRLPNTKLENEIKRMDAIMSKLKTANRPSNRGGYRLNENPFFLKLCPRVVLDPDGISLTTGMYFSRDHWRFLESDADLVGSKGGRQITFANAGRYLTNTQFIDFVQNAWIGTTPEQTSMIEPLIWEILKSGKAVIFAVKSKKDTNIEQDDLGNEEF